MPDCSICINQIQEGEEILNCGHTFHFSCIQRWLRNNNTCPMCRSQVINTTKKILKKANNKDINCLILDKSYLNNKKIQNLKIEKYFYTIKTKFDFNKYKKNSNLIFENL